MTQRGDRKASERRSGIGEDKKVPKMPRLIARWRHFNLVILVMLRNCNHLVEAYVRKGQRKALYRRERDSLEEPHEEAEMLCKALRWGKNLAFIKVICLEREQLKVMPSTC